MLHRLDGDDPLRRGRERVAARVHRHRAGVAGLTEEADLGVRLAGDRGHEPDRRAPALEQAKDPARKKQIEQEANAKIKSSLDAQGLSVSRYNQIFAEVNSNPPLRKKVLQQVEEERKRL